MTTKFREQTRFMNQASNGVFYSKGSYKEIYMGPGGKVKGVNDQIPRLNTDPNQEEIIAFIQVVKVIREEIREILEKVKFTLSKEDDIVRAIDMTEYDRPLLETVRELREIAKTLPKTCIIGNSNFKMGFLFLKNESLEEAITMVKHPKRSLLGLEKNWTKLQKFHKQDVNYSCLGIFKKFMMFCAEVPN